MHQNNNQAADDIAVVTVNPSSLAMHCGPNFLPANDRDPTELSLTYDGAAVTFSANTESGMSNYELPLSGGDPSRTYRRPYPMGW